MKSMSRRGVLLIILGVLALAATWLGVSRPPLPQVATAPDPRVRRPRRRRRRPRRRRLPPTRATSAEPAPTVETSTVTLRRGDTLLAALGRGWASTAARPPTSPTRSGPAAPTCAGCAPATSSRSPGRSRASRSPYDGSRAPGSASRRRDRRAAGKCAAAETRPDVRVEAVSGEVRRSLFEAVEALGESAQLVLELVEIFSSEFDFTADTRAGDRFRLLVEKRYAGDAASSTTVRLLVAQYLSDGRVLTGVGFEPAGGRGRLTTTSTGARSRRASSSRRSSSRGSRPASPTRARTRSWAACARTSRSTTARRWARRCARWPTARWWWRDGTAATGSRCTCVTTRATRRSTTISRGSAPASGPGHA